MHMERSNIIMKRLRGPAPWPFGAEGLARRLEVTCDMVFAKTKSALTYRLLLSFARDLGARHSVLPWPLCPSDNPFV